MKNFFLILSTLYFLFGSCATFNEYELYNAKQTNKFDNKELNHRFVVLGNLANSSASQQQELLKQLEQQFSDETKSDQTTVLFLGNNVSYDNASSENLKAEIENNLQPILETSSKLEAESIFLPGSTDWNSKLEASLSIQQKVIKEELGKHHFYPKDGCPLKRIDINDDVVLILVDADWYISNWDNYPKINLECNITTRNYFLKELSDNIRQSRGKTTVLAMSRPVFSDGKYGGRFSAKSHLKPLPVIGNAKNLIRKTGGLSQDDLSNRYYNSLRLRLISLAQQNDKVVFLSAHENNLQYLVQHNIPQIVSGSAGFVEPVKKTSKTHFAHATAGYAVLNVFTDGSSNVEFHTLQSSEVAYVGDVFKPSPTINTTFPRIEQDSIRASIFTKKEASKGGLYRFLIGNRYRTLYGEEIEAPVVYLDSLNGGLSLSGLGGGHQTESLHFRDSLKNHFTFRGMKKRSSQYIQTVTLRDYYMEDQLDGTLASKLVQDFFTGSYPYSFILAENLIKPVDLPTKHSEIFYMPKQDSIGKFNDRAGDKLYTLEYPETYTDFTLDGKTYKGRVFDGDDHNTYKMVNRIQMNSNHIIDEKLFVRARLFDMLIGDWDRHQGQWKWLEYIDGDQHIYKVFPRDRDQAFSKLGDGIIAKFAYLLVPAARIVENYSSKLKAVRQINKEPLELDIAFLSDLSLDDWLAEAQFIQNQVSDEVIEEAFAQLVPEVKEDKSVEEIKEALKGRRKQLDQIARKYYHIVSRYPKVMGTNQSEYFRVDVKNRNQVELSIFKKGEENNGAPFHHRSFISKDTKEIWIYGLADDDYFEVLGKGSKIKLIFVGGNGDDHYSVSKNNRVKIYDFPDEENDFSEAKKHAQKRIRNDYSVNHFKLNDAYQADNLILPILGSNQDLGTQIGALVQISTKRFKGSRNHNVQGQYYTATKGSVFNYSGTFPKVLGRSDLNIDLQYNSANYSKNFFGYGNGTTDLQDAEGIDYNRVYFTAFSLKPTFSRTYNSGINISYGAEYKTIELKDSVNNFAANNPSIPAYLFDPNSFLGLRGSISYSNKDYKAYPTNAFQFGLDAFYNRNVTENNDGYVQVRPSVGFDFELVDEFNLVLATKLNGDLIFGDDYEFFQAAAIGGVDQLRGFRNERFLGQYAMTHSTDLRYIFKRFKTSIAPMRFGLYSGADYGRVWVDNEDSKSWHNSVGGGFLLGIADSATINFGVFRTSDKSTKSFFTMGFNF